MIEEIKLSVDGEVMQKNMDRAYDWLKHELRVLNNHPLREVNSMLDNLYSNTPEFSSLFLLSDEHCNELGFLAIFTSENIRMDGERGAYIIGLSETYEGGRRELNVYDRLIEEAHRFASIHGAGILLGNSVSDRVKNIIRSSSNNTSYKW